MALCEVWHYAVKLWAAGPDRLRLMAAVRAVRPDLDLRSAKALIDQAPAILRIDLEMQEARAIVRSLEDLAVVEVVHSDGTALWSGLPVVRRSYAEAMAEPSSLGPFVEAWQPKPGRYVSSIWRDHRARYGGWMFRILEDTPDRLVLTFEGRGRANVASYALDRPSGRVIIERRSLYVKLRPLDLAFADIERVDAVSVANEAGDSYSILLGRRGGRKVWCMGGSVAETALAAKRMRAFMGLLPAPADTSPFSRTFRFGLWLRSGLAVVAFFVALYSWISPYVVLPSCEAGTARTAFAGDASTAIPDGVEVEVDTLAQTHAERTCQAHWQAAGAATYRIFWKGWTAMVQGVPDPPP